MTVSPAFLMYVILIVWGTLGRHFVECPSVEIYWTLLLTVTLELWALGRKTTEVKAPFSTHPTKGTYYQHDLSLLMLPLIISLRQWLSGSSTRERGCISRLFPCCCTILVGRQSLYTFYPWGVGSHVPPPRGWSSYVNYLCCLLSSWFLLFDALFMAVLIHYSLDYKTTLFYFIPWIISTLAIGSSFLEQIIIFSPPTIS